MLGTVPELWPAVAEAIRWTAVVIDKQAYAIAVPGKLPRQIKEIIGIFRAEGALLPSRADCLRSCTELAQAQRVSDRLPDAAMARQRRPAVSRWGVTTAPSGPTIATRTQGGMLRR